MFLIQAADLPILAKNYASRKPDGTPRWTADRDDAVTFASKVEAEAFGTQITDWPSWVVVSA